MPAPIKFTLVFFFSLTLLSIICFCSATGSYGGGGGEAVRYQQQRGGVVIPFQQQFNSEAVAADSNKHSQQQQQRGGPVGPLRRLLKRHHRRLVIRQLDSVSIEEEPAEYPAEMLQGQQQQYTVIPPSFAIRNDDIIEEPRRWKNAEDSSKKNPSQQQNSEENDACLSKMPRHDDVVGWYQTVPPDGALADPKSNQHLLLGKHKLRRMKRSLDGEAVLLPDGSITGENCDTPKMMHLSQQMIVFGRKHANTSFPSSLPVGNSASSNKKNRPIVKPNHHRHTPPTSSASHTSSAAAAGDSYLLNFQSEHHHVRGHLSFRPSAAVSYKKRRSLVDSPAMAAQGRRPFSSRCGGMPSSGPRASPTPAASATTTTTTSSPASEQNGFLGGNASTPAGSHFQSDAASLPCISFPRPRTERRALDLGKKPKSSSHRTSSIATHGGNRKPPVLVMEQSDPNVVGVVPAKTVVEFQVVHPSSPREKEWVMVAGNESAVDNVLAVSLLYGGRLVSMGFYKNAYGTMDYYAIMHRFVGPVFLKPNPYTYNELLKVTQENEEADMALTQLCGHDDDSNGRVLFSSYWERVPDTQTRVWFPGSPESDAQKDHFENEGFRLVSLCGFSVRKKVARYVGIWQKPALRVVPYEAHYGLTLSECLELNDRLAERDYVATQFRVFRNADEILCCAIWEYLPRRRHWIDIGTDIRLMHRKYRQTPTLLPRQISHFLRPETGRLEYVVLWSDVHSFRYPNPHDIWMNNRTIPVNYLPGTRDQLQPEQLTFILKRVERFMRELDIPGLSVAISRNEQLKYAAGFGYGNVRRREQVTPHHQFRVGSVSKPITAAAIMILVDQGRLKLDQKIFGEYSIFGMEFARNGRSYGRHLTDITVRHLLEHTCGGWNNIDSDPAWLEPDMATAELIEKVIAEQALNVRPGKVWIYSNFGYQLLGFIIERISGLSYEDFVKRNIWERIGVKDIQVARPTLSEKSRREVLYYMSGRKLGFNPYEMLVPERTGPWGGWIASPIELLKLMAHLDGFKRKADLLSDWSLREWIVPTSASNETYGLGWSLNIMGFNGWQHDGRMPGSASMLVRLDNGISMAVVVNKEYSERDFFHELGYILHHIGNNCDWWSDPRIDMFF